MKFEHIKKIIKKLPLKWDFFKMESIYNKITILKLKKKMKIIITIACIAYLIEFFQRNVKIISIKKEDKNENKNGKNNK